MAVILITLLKNKLQDFPPIAGHRVRKFITIRQETSFPQAVRFMKNQHGISHLVKVIVTTEWQDCVITLKTKQTKRFTDLHWKKTMFYIIKELYVLSVMQIIFHQATTMMAGIFNKHFYRHFYGSEVWCTIWKEIKLQIIQFSQLFTNKFALFQRMHAFFH